MKLITANKLNRLWKTGILPALAKKLDNVKILTTTEQVTANTSNENIASAPVVKELINDLAQQPEWIRDSTTGRITGYRFGGADPVFPFSGGNGTLTVNFSFNMKMNKDNGSGSTGTGTLTAVIENGEVKSHTITGSGWATTVGGVSNASSCTAETFKITSITWTPDY